MIRCWHCDDVVDPAVAHDVHDDQCPVFVAMSDERDPSVDDLAACTCPERYACSSCCVLCGGDR